MKKILSLLFLLPIICLSVFGLSACIPDWFEEELSVVFMNEGEVVGTGSVTQYKNVKTPEISDAYVPDGYRFYGWTVYNPDAVDPASPDFKSTYVGGGKMLHYMDVKGHENSEKEVVLSALIIDKSLVPKEYHYAVVAWYDKESTSGITSIEIETLNSRLAAYLGAEGVSEEDIATIVIRGYTGNVGPSCGQIMADEDVDIMLGWGSVSNVTSTGGMPESMLLESKVYSVTYNGAIKNRYIHRLTESESVLKVWDWLQSDDCTSIFN